MACKRSSATRGITAISRWSISKRWASEATSRNPIAGAATGRRNRRRRFTAIVGASAGRGVCACCDSAASAWSGRSRISTRRADCAACTTNILKRLLIHVGGFNLGMLMRHLIGVGTPRALQGRVHAIVATLLTLIRMPLEPPLRHWYLDRRFSIAEWGSMARYTVAHLRFRETDFTTGC
jgi:hypothetical protein